jgi:hypothetical protein
MIVAVIAPLHSISELDSFKTKKIAAFRTARTAPKKNEIDLLVL